MEEEGGGEEDRGEGRKIEGRKREERRWMGGREREEEGGGVRSFPGLPVNWGVKSSKTTGVTSTPPLTRTEYPYLAKF